MVTTQQNSGQAADLADAERRLEALAERLRAMEGELMVARAGRIMAPKPMAAPENFEWKLAADPQASLGLYDRRPDDVVLRASDAVPPQASGTSSGVLVSVLLLPRGGQGGVRGHAVTHRIEIVEHPAEAQGEFLVVLDDRCTPVEGWLDHLIAGFAMHPKAAVIGSKIFAPGGGLIHAGGIMSRDGSCTDYGAGDDPNRPCYCFVRQVDFAAGEAFAIRADLARDLDDTDNFGDADLCLRLHQAGHEIWYQPLARVVLQGKISRNALAQKKFYLRRREELLDYGTGVAERGVKRRLLVIDGTTPQPERDAGSVQTLLALKAARELGYKVHFVPLDNWLYQPDATLTLQEMGVECAYAPYENGLDPYLRRYGASFEVILVYRLDVFEKSVALIEILAPQATLLYHVADLHFLRAERQSRLDHDEMGLAQAVRVKQRELGLAARAHGVITHSRFEAELLAAEAPEAQVCLWPLMVDEYGTDVGYAPRQDICFLGFYGHPPNVDAVRHFIQDIWPLVKRQLPESRFIIGGADPTPDVRMLASDDVIVTGRITDLRDLFDSARVFVAPLRVGAGVKGKLITALSYGIPVVASPIAVEGAELAPEMDVLVANDPAEFAAQIIRLYRDEALWNRLSKSGQTVVREKYSSHLAVHALASAIDLATYKRLGVPQPNP
jgi:glycosyltransferase involved in cell wall biosynthesis